CGCSVGESWIVLESERPEEYRRLVEVLYREVNVDLSIHFFLLCSLLSVSLGLDFSVGRLLRPTGGRIFKVLLPSIGCCVEQAVSVRERFSSTRIGRVGVENVVVD